MKKLHVIAFLALGSVALSTGCKKCMECEYDVNTTTYTSGEICGSEEELEAVEEEWDQSAEDAGTSVTCRPI